MRGSSGETVIKSSRVQIIKGLVCHIREPGLYLRNHREPLRKMLPEDWTSADLHFRKIPLAAPLPC